MAIAAALERHLVATHDARYESYRAFLKIPEYVCAAEHAADCRTRRRLAGVVERGPEHAELCETVVTRSSTPTGCTQRALRPSSSTAITTSSRSIRSTCGPRRRSSRSSTGSLLARGAADDKGQIHAHLMAAAAILATRGGFPVNLRYLFEGEEESGSVNLERWLAANKERLAADVVVVSDTGFFEGNLPAITVGLRGLMYAQIDVVGSAVDLHSGGYGGAVENPANALAQIIAALKGPDGRIRIPGFYDDVVAR